MINAPTASALAGLRIIDFTRVLGGPSATQILADHGADVIKVEPPQGDETREWGPPFEAAEASGKKRSSYYLAINRSKRGIALDLRTPEGRDIAFRLLESADVMIENFKPGTLEKWGMGYEEVLAEKFPKLIHARISGFGEHGPLGHYPGYDAVAQAMSGLISVNGAPESGPVRIGVPLVDLATGLNIVIGILMALQERHRSGKGQFVEATLYDTGLSLMHPHSANWLMSGKLPKLTGNAHTNVAPYDLFPTKKGMLFLGIGNDAQFAKACKLLGHPELATDPRFATNTLRLENREAMTAELSAILMTHEAEEISHALLEAGVPAGPAHNVGEALSHPHTMAREMVIEEDGYRGVASPIKFSRTPAAFHDTPPEFGEDTRDVLHELGFGDDDIAALIDRRIVFGKDGT